MTPIDYFHKVNSASENLQKQSKEITKIVSVLKEAREEGKQVFICGNGGSAGTSTHMTADLFKIGEIKALCLNDNIPLVSALTNDDGWGMIYVKQLERLMNPGDVLIAFSVHGGSGSDKAGPWSQNITNAINYAKSKGGKTIGFSGFDGGWMKDNCDVCVVVNVDSTPIVEAMHVVLHHYVAFELQKGDRK